MAKRKVDQDGNELETGFEVFMRNYNNVPGFKALIKLIIYFAFIFIIIVVAAGANEAENNNETPVVDGTTTTTTTTTTKKIVYKDTLEALKKDNLVIYTSAIINGETYIVDSVNKNGILTGYYENKIGTKKFKIENNKIYELALDTKTENTKLFELLDIDFIIPANLVDLLLKNRSLKVLEDDIVIYTYEINKNNIKYEIKTYVKDDICYKIEINGNEANYLITYK